jgi:mannose-1-phosphate guanylyltransferase
LQKTVDRLEQLTDIPEIITVTNRDHFFVTRDEYAAGGAAYRHLLVLEPSARNTAPAAALGALAALARHGDDVTVLVLPADHLVEDHAAFAATVRDALPLAERNLLVTFGIKPTYAETGFGYIERGEALAGVADLRSRASRKSLRQTSRKKWSGPAGSTGTRACSAFVQQLSWLSLPACTADARGGSPVLGKRQGGGRSR